MGMILVPMLIRATVVSHIVIKLAKLKSDFLTLEFNICTKQFQLSYYILIAPI